MKAVIRAFLVWAEKVARGPNGQPSSQRVVGLSSAFILGVVFKMASVMLILRGQYQAFLDLFTAFSVFTATSLGLITVSKFGSGGKKDGEP